MANDGNGGGKSMSKPLGMGISMGGGKVNVVPTGTASTGVPYGQTPGIGNGMKDNSMNVLTPNAEVIWSAPSDLMKGMSDKRGSGGNK